MKASEQIESTKNHLKSLILDAQSSELDELLKIIEEIKINYNMGIIYPYEVVKQINKASKMSIDLIKQWDK